MTYQEMVQLSKQSLTINASTKTLVVYVVQKGRRSTGSYFDIIRSWSTHSSLPSYVWCLSLHSAVRYLLGTLVGSNWSHHCSHWHRRQFVATNFVPLGLLWWKLAFNFQAGWCSCVVCGSTHLLHTQQNLCLASFRTTYGKSKDIQRSITDLLGFIQNVQKSNWGKHLPACFSVFISLHLY